MTGAYVGSDFYTGNNDITGKSTMMNAINNAFGSDHILTHKEHLANAVTNGYESAAAWYDSTAELMTERMVYGATSSTTRWQERICQLGTVLITGSCLCSGTTEALSVTVLIGGSEM